MIANSNIDILLEDGCMDIPEVNIAEMEAIWAKIALLTPAQQSIAMLVGRDFAEPAEIAKGLGRSTETVNAHLRVIYNATGLHSITQIAIAMYIKTLVESNEAIAPPEFFLHQTLTRREQEVAYLVAQGFSNLTIGMTLGISQETAKCHLTNIFNKLGYSRRTELAVRVLRENFFLLQRRHSPAPQ